jgi:hypothetical protein
VRILVTPDAGRGEHRQVHVMPTAAPPIWRRCVPRCGHWIGEASVAGNMLAARR